MGFVCAGNTPSPPSVTREAHRVIEGFTCVVVHDEGVYKAVFSFSMLFCSM